MSLGSLVLQVQQKYQHGFQTAHFRDSVRLRILDTQPIADMTDRTCEIHVLTYEKDWLNLIWALKTFYYYAERRYALCIHDDGTLTPANRATLQYHFPEARLITRAEADRRVLANLENYPRCLKFRQTNHLAPKIFDFRDYLMSDRMLLLDSDVLFFAQPRALLERIEDKKYRLNTVNGDVASAYTVDPAAIRQQFGFELIDRFNSGFGLIHKASMQLDWIEEFLAMPDIVGHFWRIEQTLYALLSCRYGAELLPAEYDVHLETGINDSPSRHYVGKIRHLMYSEGMRQLMQQKFLKALSLC